MQGTPTLNQIALVQREVLRVTGQGERAVETGRMKEAVVLTRPFFGRPPVAGERAGQG